MDTVIMSKKLEMSLEQMEQEILFMRAWDKYVAESLGTDQYNFLCHNFALAESSKWIESQGGDSEEFRKMMEGAKNEQ